MNVDHHFGVLNRELLNVLSSLISSKSEGMTRIGVACSGGQDSMLLVERTLCVIKEEKLPIELIVLTVDHQLHEKSSLNARSVCEYWGEQGLECHHLYGDRHLIEQGAGIEDGAREARYAALHDALQRFSIVSILFAHHAGDQAETLLMRLQGPSGLRGLRGIPPEREWIRRPWLGVEPSLVSSAHKHLALPCFSDPTNQDLRYLRNAIRSQIIPRFDQVFTKGWIHRISESARFLSEEFTLLEYFLGRFTRELIVDNTHLGRMSLMWNDEVHSSPEQLKISVLRYFYTKALYQLSDQRDQRRIKDHLSSLFELWWGDRSQVYTLPHGLIAWGGRRALIICSPRLFPTLPSQIIITLQELNNAPLVIRWGEWNISFDRANKPLEDDGHHDMGMTLDPSRLMFPLRLTLAADGTRYRPAHSPGRKRIKRLWSDRQVPLFERVRLPILTDSKGEVLWAPYCRPAHDFVNRDSNVTQNRFFLSLSLQKETFRLV